MAEVVERQGIVAWAATEYGVEAGKVMSILRGTCFSVAKNEDPATDAEVAALLNVARHYHLNPFLRQIYAFRNKQSGGIVPIVGVDGWAQIIADDPRCDGFEFRESPETLTDPKGKVVPKWMECVMYRKDRAHPTIIREYFLEVVRSTFAWDTTPCRMLRHRTFMQAGRIALGLTGITDEDEAARIIEAQGSIEGESKRVPTEKSATSRMAAALGVDGGTDKPKETGVAAETSKPAETPGTAVPTLTDIEEAIKVMESPDRMQDLLLAINAHANQDQQRALMKQWNERVMAVKGISVEKKEAEKPKQEDGPATDPATAKEKEKGTPQRLGRIKLQLAEAPDIQCLDEILDLCRGYEWTEEQQKQIAQAGGDRRKALVPGSVP